MSDGERLVWAASFALAFERDGDSIVAAREAARAVEHLRDALIRRAADGDLLIPKGNDVRGFLDEMVNVP